MPLNIKATFVCLALLFVVQFGFAIEGFQIFTENNLQGIKDNDGRVVIAAKYQKLGWSNGSTKPVGKTIGYKHGFFWGLINLENKKTGEAKYTGLNPHDSQFIIASKKDKFSNTNIFGLINTKEKALLSFKYSSLQSANSVLIGSAKKPTGHRYGLVGTNDKVILSFKYAFIESLDNDLLLIKNDGEKLALFNAAGKGLSNFKYDRIERFDENYVQVIEMGKKGLLSNSGEQIITPIYKNIKKTERGIEALAFPEWQVTNDQNAKLNTLYFDQLIPSSSEFYHTVINGKHSFVKISGESVHGNANINIKKDFGKYLEIAKNNKAGLIDLQGKTIVHPVYDSIVWISPYIYAFKEFADNGTWHVFNELGIAINKKGYSSIKPFSNGLFRIKDQGFWGFMDGNGVETIACKFKSVSDFEGNFCIVEYYDGQGVIDRTGVWRINPYQRIIEQIDEHLFIFVKDLSYGLMHIYDGTIYETGNRLSKHALGILEVNAANKKGLINKRGKSVLPIRYDSISDVKKGFCIIELDGAYGFINAKDQSIFAVKKNLTWLGFPSEDYFPTRIDGKYAFLDTLGRMRIANRYDSVGLFIEGIAPIRLRGKWAAINKDEQLILQPIYAKIENFHNGLSIVHQGNKVGLIDKKGNLVQKIEFDAIIRLEGGKFLSKKNKLYGLLDLNGKRLIYPKYDKITDLHNGSLIIERANKFGLLSIDGMSTIPLDFDQIIFDNTTGNYFCKRNAKWKLIL